jgi:hypothetical protein
MVDIGPYSPDYKLRSRIDTELPPDITNLTTDVETLQTEVETATTGLLDRMTAAEADIVTAQDAADDAQADVDAIIADAAIVAGPTALTNDSFLTAPLLRKVVAVAAGPNASTVNTAHGITTPSKIIGCVIQLTNGTNHLCFGQGGMLSDTIAHSIIVTIDGTNVGMTSGSGGDYHLYAGSIILLYVD